jgi:hypothetical protein
MTDFAGTTYIEKTTFKFALKFRYEGTMVDYMFRREPDILNN